MEEDPHTTIPYSPEKPAVASEPPQENLPTGYAISIIALGASALVSTVSLIVILLFLATGRIKFH